MSGFVSRHRGKLVVLGVIVLGPLAAHFAIGRLGRFDPPALTPPTGEVTTPVLGLRRFGKSSVRERGKILEVHLAGTPAEIGYAHARMLYPEMVHNEGILLDLFHKQVPVGAFRTLLLDLAELRYRDLDAEMDPARLQEIRAGSLAFQPDPYAALFPTYQRFVYLNALYDISLSFEHSPLIGCTTFALRGPAVHGGGALLARAFDFEIDPVFDEHKAVFFVREDGKIPFASVAWPGLVGVVSGMNAEGVAVVVHGGRAGPTHSAGEPVVHALRRVLQTARTSEEAIAALRERDPMVSHIVIAADSDGKTAVIERVPGEPLYFSWLPERTAVTNHFRGPASDDPKNLVVRSRTSTIARYMRGQQIVARLRGAASAEDAVALLRDRRGINDTSLPLGDRSAIDALIAAHGVVMDTRHHVLWVSESPHLLGRFVGFDLDRFLSSDPDPSGGSDLPSIAEDPLFTSGQYQTWRSEHLAKAP